MLMAARRGAFFRVPAIQKSREEGGERREEKGKGVRVGRGSEQVEKKEKAFTCSI